MMKYRIAAVSYINTLPFLEGLKDCPLHGRMDLVLVPPAQCAELFIEGSVDIALVPVGAMQKMSGIEFITDYGIGCDGAVRTVMLVSKSDLDGIRAVQFDRDSRTSNLLVQVLAKRHWKKEWSFFTSEDPDEWRTIQGGARVAIGDKVFALEKEDLNFWDMGEAWKEDTGLPFLFAAWVSRPGIDPEFKARLNRCFQAGISSIPGMDLNAMHREYLANSISFPFDRKKKVALELFLQEAAALQENPIFS